LKEIRQKHVVLAGCGHPCRLAELRGSTLTHVPAVVSLAVRRGSSDVAQAKNLSGASQRS